MTVKFVTAMRSFTYDLEAVKETMKEFASRHDKGEEISDEEAFDMIRDWAYEDLRSAISRHDIKFIDEGGNELWTE